MKKLINKFFVGIAVILTLNSCKTTPPTITDSKINVASNTIQKDSSVTRDTAATVAKAISSLVLALNQDTTPKITLDSTTNPYGPVIGVISPAVPISVPETSKTVGRATVRTKIVHDTLYIECDCDSVEVKFKKIYEAHWSSIVAKKDSTIKNITNTETIVYKTRKSVQYLAMLGALFLVIIGYKIFKKIHPIV